MHISLMPQRLCHKISSSNVSSWRKLPHTAAISLPLALKDVTTYDILPCYTRQLQFQSIVSEHSFTACWIITARMVHLFELFPIKC